MMMPAKISTSGLRLTHDPRSDNIGWQSYFSIRYPAPTSQPALSHLAYHIDQRWLAAFYDFDCLPQCLDQIFGFSDRPRAPAAVGARHCAEVDVWIFDANSDRLVFYWAVT